MKLMAVKGSKMGLNALDKAFIFAVKNEGKAIVELLLKKGAHINQKRTHGTALHYAALSGDLLKRESRLGRAPSSFRPP